LIYLDTHVVVWLYAGLKEKFTPAAHQLIQANALVISPIVQLELQYLHEIQRINRGATTVVTDLAQRIGLQLCGQPFAAVITQALMVNWTRDPFDRLIVATAAIDDRILLSKDVSILAHYPFAKWTDEKTADRPVG
jgi:PIN domain nuclease of toxin-antitoxin system